MALSEYEQQMLEELEAQLTNEDPSFASAMKEPEKAQAGASMQFSVRHVVVGLLVAVLGIVVLVAGVATEIVLIGVAGVAIIFGGVYYMGLGRTEKVVSARAHAPRNRFDGSFMQRQEQRWERRRQQ
ncbi:MAG: DUF3040 domain-containing protein [Actinomycetaceae bacterium]|nr:DUF3040 domain-containing protein [Actinomycetaceae bacterium]MDY6083026.1 DUF3040 domain-containing protein [Actinomycetaceae bacterium]